MNKSPVVQVIAPARTACRVNIKYGKMIISASRRTDIPSIYSEWFMDRVREGFTTVSNPRNPKQQRVISLRPEDVDCIVFWSKNPKPMFTNIRELDDRGFSYYFQFTLTPYGNDIERNLPSKIDLIEIFKELSRTISKDRVIWRYDPIILNNNYSIEYHIEAFEHFASELSPYTNRCVISFVDMYNFVTKRCAEKIRTINEKEIYKIVDVFSKIALSVGLELTTCSENYDLSRFGIKKGSCIDKSIIEKILLRPIPARKDRGQRFECDCIKSVDIGSYNSCSNGCIYCYANRSIHLNLLENNR